jgi:hypothetical protein
MGLQQQVSRRAQKLVGRLWCRGAIVLSIHFIAVSFMMMWLAIAPAAAQPAPPPPSPTTTLFKQTKNDDPPQPMTDEERAALSDPFFQLVLQNRTDVTTLPAIRQLLKASGQSVFVVDERIKDADQRPDGKPALRRAIITPQGDGNLNQNVMLSMLFNPEQFPSSNFIEVMGWDEQQGRFNFYKFDQSGGEAAPSWKFRGSSQDADLLSVENRRGTCMQCHINGGTVMKELFLPWNHWDSFSDKIPYLIPGTASWPIARAADSPLKDLDGAQTLETATILPTITRFNQRRIDALKSPNGQAIADARRLLKPLFVTTEFNLISSDTLSPLHPFAPPPSGSNQTVTIPDSFFINSAVLQRLGIFASFGSFANLGSQDYAHLVRQTKTALGGRQPGDTNFAWFGPEASFIDSDFVGQLIDQEIVPRNFVAAVLAIDLETPILSGDRARLWNPRIIPAQFKIGPRNDLIPQVINHLVALNPAPGTPEATFLQLLRNPNAVDALKQRVDQYVNRERQRLAPTRATPKARSDEWIRLYKLSLQRREAMMTDPVLKSLDERAGTLLLSRGNITAAVAPLPSTVTQPRPRPTLRRGSRGNDVVFLQQRLRASGVFQGAIDGDFGPITEAAVIAFQRRSNLTPDGVVGPATWAALESRS